MTASAQWRNDRTSWGRQAVDSYVKDGHKAECPRCGAKVPFYGGQPSRHYKAQEGSKTKKTYCV